MGKLGCWAKTALEFLAEEAAEEIGYALGSALNGLFVGAEEAAGPPPDEPKPASGVSHHIKHSSFLAALAGAVVGALITAALTATAVGLIGVGGFAGALVAGVLVGAVFGSLISGATSWVTTAVDSVMPANDGPVIVGSPMVLVGGLPAARATVDIVGCVEHHAPQLIAQGSQSVYIDGFPAARKDDKVICGAPLAQGVADVLFGGPQGTYLEIESEFSLFERAILIAVDFVIPPTGLITKAAPKLTGKLANSLGKARNQLAKGINKLSPKLLKALGKGPALLTKANQAVSKQLGKLGKALGFGSCNAGKTGDGANNRKKTSDADGQRPTDQKCCEGEPIDTSTGAVVDEQADFTIGSSFPFTFVRSYDSRRTTKGLLGQGWRDSLGEHLELSHGGEHVEFHATDGAIVPFDLIRGSNRVFNRKHAHYTLIRSQTELAIHDRRDGTTRRFQVHEGRGWLRRVEDEHGNGIDIDYEGAHPARVRHTDGPELSLRHVGDSGTNATITIERVDGGVVSSLARYKIRRGLLVDADVVPKERITYGYDEYGRRASWHDHDNESWVRYAYDEQGRCTWSRAAEGLYGVDLEYDDALRLTRVRDSKGHVTTYYFDEAKRLVRKVDPLGNSSSWAYNRHGEVVAITDPLGNAEQFEYDPAAGLLLEHVDREGHCTEYFYDERERVIAVADALGRAWTYERGPRGEVVTAEAPDGARFEYEYGPRCQLTRIVRGDGGARTFDYDEQGRIVAESDWAGNRHRYEYDGRDRVSSITDPADRREQLFWDPRDLLVAVVHPDRSHIALERDHAGLIRAVTDENGHTARREYGAFELLRAVSDAEGRRYEMRRDPDHLGLSELLAPDGRRYRFEYDAAGRVTREIDYAGRVTRYGHDAAGNRIERINAAGQVTRYGYDKNGRLIRIEADGETTVYEYDVLGLLVRAKNDNCELLWEYDPMGRVLRSVQNGEVLEYGYDAAGRCIERELKPGPWQKAAHRTGYAHDVNGRLTALELDGETLRFERDVRGNPTSIRFGTECALEQRFDERGLLCEQTLVVGEKLPELHRRYAYDAAGNLVEVNDTYWGTTRYWLDRSDRILAAVQPGNTGEAFAYDANGLLGRRRLVTEQSDLDLVFENGPDGLPCRVGDTEYEFDDVGRLIRKTVTQNGFRPKTWTFLWDSRDRLLEVRTPQAEIWRYAYDPLGRRVLKYNPGTRASVHFLWDGDVLLRELHLQAKGEGMEQVARVVHWEHEPGSFRPLAREMGGEIHLVICDGIGSPVGVSAADGGMVWRGRKSVWGTVINQDRRRGIDEMPIGFPGQYLDEESGFFYNRHRYYEPDLGSYIAPDPIGLAGGAQPWPYVHNPNGWHDPLGLSGCDKHVDLTEHKAAYILHRHKHGAGISGKTEFPQNWSDQKILHEISDVATDHKSLFGTDSRGTPYAIGTRDGIEIRVNFYPSNSKYHGKIATGYPLNTAPNP